MYPVGTSWPAYFTPLSAGGATSWAPHVPDVASPSHWLLRRMAALPDPVYHNQSASLDQWRHHLPAGVSGTTASYPYQTASPAGHPGVFGAGVTPLSPTQLVYGQGPLVKVESSGHQLNWVTSCDPAQPAVVPSLQQGTAWGVWPVGPGPVQSQPPVQYQYHPVQAVHYPVQQHQRPVYPSSDAARSTLAVPALVQSTAAVHPPTHQMTVPLPAAPVPVQTSARPSQTTPVRSSTPIHFSTQVPSPAVTPITVHSPVPAQPPVPVQEIPVKEVTGIPVSPAGPASSLIPRGVAPSMLPPLVPAFPVTTLPSTQRPVHMLGPSPCQPRPTLHQGAPHTQLRARDLTSQPVTSSATPGTPLVTSPDTLRRTSSPDSGYSSSGSTSPSGEYFKNYYNCAAFPFSYSNFWYNYHLIKNSDRGTAK